MGEINNIENICGFYVSGMHLVTMILPYIQKQIQRNIKIETFFEYNLIQNANKVLENIALNNKDKQKLLNINWSSSKTEKYFTLEKKLKHIFEENKKINFLISGSKKYINEMNEIINKFLQKNGNKFNGVSNISIIDCYEVSEFDDNIRDILNVHDYILNTAGIHKIEDIFEDYKKQTAI